MIVYVVDIVPDPIVAFVFVWVFFDFPNFGFDNSHNPSLFLHQSQGGGEKANDRIQILDRPKA